MSLHFIIYSVILINLTNSATFRCDKLICDFGICNFNTCNDYTYICTNKASTCSLECGSGCQNITFLSNAQNTQISCTKSNACNDISISISDINSKLTIGCTKNNACSNINIQCTDPNNCHCQDYNNQECINNVVVSQSTTTTTTSTTTTSTTTTQKPTQFPTKIITSNPSKNPTNSPSKIPTSFPSQFPSKNPTYIPTLNPSYTPTLITSTFPTINPSYTATLNPSYTPTENQIGNTQILSVHSEEFATESTTEIYIITKDEIITVHMNDSELTNTDLYFILIIGFISILFIGICIAIPIYICKYKKKKLRKKKEKEKEFSDNSNNIEMVCRQPNDDLDFWANPLYKRKQVMDVTNAVTCTLNEFVIKSDSEQSDEQYNRRMTNNMNGEMQLALPQSMLYTAMIKELPKSPNSNDEGMIIGSVGSPSCADIGSILYEPGIGQITPGGDFAD